MNQNNPTKIEEDEIDLKEIFEVLFRSKLLIFVTTIIISLVVVVYIYYKPYIYNTYAILEIKSDNSKTSISEDFLLGGIPSIGNNDIDKQIEILKTFNTNNQSLNNVDFKVQYFIDDKYKQIEIYKDIPISIKNIKILNRNIIGKKIKVVIFKDKYKLFIENSLKTNLLGQTIELDDKFLEFDTNISNKYFQFNIKKLNNSNKIIYFKLNGSNRDIYENIIKNNLFITQVNKKVPILKIAFHDTIPLRSKLYVESIVNNFISQSIINNSEQNDRILEFIQGQLQKIKIKLKKSEELLEKYRITYQVINPTIQSEAIIKELSKIELDISHNELRLKMINNIIYFVKKNINLDSIAPSLAELNDLATLKLITSLQDLQIKKIALNAEFTNKHPKVIKIESQIKAFKRKILFNLKNLQKTFKAKNIDTSSLKKKYEAKLETIPTKEKKLVELKRDYEVNSKMYAFLLEKNAEKEILKISTLSPYRVIDEVYTQENPIKPKKTLIFIFSIILGTMIGIIIAFIREFLNNKIKNKSDIEKNTTIPIYGIIPILKVKQLKLEVIKEPKSPFAESYRTIRTNLEFIENQENARVLLLTSTIAGEGKTTTSANLAGIFSLANYKSIVINLDMRRPILHKLFDLNPTTGVSTYLSGNETLDKIIYKTKSENIDIIPAGPIPPNPSELLISTRLEDMLNILRKEYDYIIIDTPPIGLVADTITLTKLSDLNLIIFRENYAQKNYIDDLNQLVDKHSIKHIGIILNSSDISKHGYGYGY